jgi:peptide/nickel transport system ATP-binding protein
VTSVEGTEAPASVSDEQLLAIEHLDVAFATADGWLPVVEDVSFAVGAGEIVGLVGESGSGKTVTSLSIMGLHGQAARVRGAIRFGERDLLKCSRDELRAIRGDEISMIFQEPMTSLNPAFTVGNQIAEAVRLHRDVSRKQAWARAVEMLDRVGIPDATRRVKSFPHEFSGGMRQRAMIAMALVNEPKLLIADEPTTALDVTIQAQILELLRSLQAEIGMSVIFVTHDLGVIADISDRVVVMYAGQVVEESPVDRLFAQPGHPYTEGLLDSMPQVAIPGESLRVIPGRVPNPDEVPTGCRFQPRCAHGAAECAGAPVMLRSLGSEVSVRCVRQPGLELAGSRWSAAIAAPDAHARPGSDRRLLEVRGLTKHFAVHSTVLRRTIGLVRAVDGIDFALDEGETLGLVGESGSGKSTVARLVLRLIEPTAGEVVVGGANITRLSSAELRRARREMQIVFQDPYSSLDPRATIAESVGEPLEVHEGITGKARDRRVVELLDRVGLGAHLVRRYPHEFSGGQRQRIAIARALALNPKLVICDEAVSSLDVSTQSQVINLLAELQSELGLAFLFIAHDLSVVRHISRRIAVMYLGRIVEIGDAEEVYRRPRHPYTEALLSAIPIPEPGEQRNRTRIVLQGDVPSPFDAPTGCRFHTRCPYAMEVCGHIDPAPLETGSGTTVFCHLHTEGPKLGGAPLASSDART